MSTPATVPSPATGGTAGPAGTGRRTAETNWWLWGVVGGLVGLAAILFFTLGGGDGAAQTAPAPAVQLQPAGVTGATAIVPPPSPLEAKLGDLKSLDAFVQARYIELKDEAERQRANSFKNGNYYLTVAQNKRLADEAAGRSR